jgi:hypothetical protein
VGRFSFLLLLFSLVANFTWAQSETATVSGQVVDPSGLNITGAQVKLVDIDRDITTGAATNTSGLYTFPSVRPGRYRMEVTAAGFKVVNVTGVTVNVQDHLEQNFKLVVGSVSESITVEAGATLVDTESATVSTVIDRQFAENLPMNGRSFQTLIELTPGVVLTTSSSFSGGQFSVNGQRPDSNYWMIDGVSANIGMSSVSQASDTLSGALGGFSAQGGTNSLISVDAMQEFRIQTSTFAPEFGRTPGGQISIVTRSGTNQFHGTAFDYLRNDALDASTWFNGFTNVPPLPKAEERQNDFGGTLGGPIIKDRTFFFFSYEGLRLRLPMTSLSVVPDASYTPGTTNSRQNAIPAMQRFINAFPLPSPNSPEILCNSNTDYYCPPSGESGSAALNASYSNRSTLNASSLRLDHRLNDKLTLFARYNYSPSELLDRPGVAAGAALSLLEAIRIPTQTSTLGATWLASPTLTNDLRVNYSRVDSISAYTLDNFDGAVPFLSSAAGLPSPYTNQDSEVGIYVEGLNAILNAGDGKTIQTQRQFNFVDSVSLQIGSHTFKFGVDYRRLTPSVASPAYEQTAGFLNVSEMESGTLSYGAVDSSSRVPLVLQNLGTFAQDTWRVRQRLTLTYGLRWDIDFCPRTSSAPSLPAVSNFNDLATLGIAPPGTAVFKTQYANLAPRIGVAYELFQRKGWESVLRGGWGVFYDLATTQLQAQTSYYPFGSTNYVTGQYPLDPTSAAGGEPAPISPSNAIVYAVDPHLKAPYTQEWNFAFEQSLGAAQSLSATYAGAVGRRLLLTEAYSYPNPNIEYAFLVSNYGTSDYNALQLQFRRRLADGLQALASYGWAHSIDTGSTGSGGLTYGDIYSRQLGANQNRGPSDFDIRNSASVALTYDIPAAQPNRLAQIFSQGWSTQNTFQVRSATPVDVSYPFVYFIGTSQVTVRPDVVPGQPFYLNEPECLIVLYTPCPGGKGLNPAAFIPPPLDPTTSEPTRQGDVGRNRLRGFGTWQWDFAVHRDFPVHEQMELQFRAELFNILNHPNFGPPNGSLNTPYFGWSSQTLGQSLNAGNDGSGGFSALYQLGGPRSVQLALKLKF